MTSDLDLDTNPFSRPSYLAMEKARKEMEAADIYRSDHPTEEAQAALFKAQEHYRETVKAHKAEEAELNKRRAARRSGVIF